MAEFAVQLDAFAEKVEGQLHEVMTKSVLEVRSRLIIRSPVDTGRFRANWQYGVDAMPAGTLESTGAPPAARIPEKAFDRVHYLANNLPYANRLENGWSKQAPSGLVGLTVIEWPDIVASAVASVQR